MCPDKESISIIYLLNALRWTDGRTGRTGRTRTDGLTKNVDWSQKSILEILEFSKFMISIKFCVFTAVNSRHH